MWCQLYPTPTTHDAASQPPPPPTMAITTTTHDADGNDGDDGTKTEPTEHRRVVPAHVVKTAAYRSSHRRTLNGLGGASGGQNVFGDRHDAKCGAVVGAQHLPRTPPRRPHARHTRTRTRIHSQSHHTKHESTDCGPWACGHAHSHQDTARQRNATARHHSHSSCVAESSSSSSS